MPTILTYRPTVTVGTGEEVEVKWFAVGSGYPNIFKFQRQDFYLGTILQSTLYTGKIMAFVASSGGFALESKVGSAVTIISPTYGTQRGNILAIQTNSGAPLVHIDIDYQGDEFLGGVGNVGVINLLSDRLGYQAEFTFTNALTNEVLGTQKVSSLINGDIFLDINSFLNKFIADKPLNTFPTVNVSEEGSSIPFLISWKETGFPFASSQVRSITDTFYGAMCANQLQDPYGGNLADHTILLNGGDSGNGHKGKFLTVFEEPIYYPGYPFSIGFVIQDVVGFAQDIAKKEEQIDAAGNIIATTTPILQDTDYTKIHQLVLDGTYSPNVECIDVALDTGPFSPTPTITGIVLINTTDCNPATGTYTGIFAVYYENLRTATDLITVTVGAATPVQQISTSSGFPIYVQNLPADGGLKTVVAQLNSNPTPFTATDLYTAPNPCQSCQVFDVLSIGTSNVDLVNQTFDWTFQMDYANSPGGNISVNGVVIAAPTAGTNAVVTLPLTSGTTVDLTLFFVSDTSCNFSATEFITLPTTYVKRVKEELVASGPNSLPNLANTPRTGSAILLEYRGVTYTSIGASPDFNVVGNTVTWNNNVAQVDIQTGESVYVTYETLAAAAPGDNWVYEAKEIVSTNVIPGFLQFTVIANSLTMYYNGVAYQSFGADQALSIGGNSATWMNNQGVDLQPGDTVYFVYNTLVATGNEEAILEFDTITAQNVMPDGLVNQPQDTTDLILFYRGIGLFNFGGDATISLSSQIFTFNPAAAGFNIDAGDQTFPFYQKTV